MSSVPPDDADLTARAKIRNAAIAHFTQDGFQRANLRAIAAAAGVSVGLIPHHFGSKEGLRAACDEYVLGVLTKRAHAAGTQELLGEYLSSPEEYRLYVQYLARAIVEDTPAAGTFVSALVEDSEALLRAGASDGTMRPSSDPRALAVLSILTSVALLTMPPPFARALGFERFGPDVLRRMTVPTLELFTHGLYTDATMLRNAEAAWQAQGDEG
ncbi:TetR/AcrR family transcriptional regulator [Flindersiella endophytica]